MLKILMVMPRLSTTHGGGGVVIATNLIKSLAQRGHQIGVFTTDYELDHELFWDLRNRGNIWIFLFKTILTLASLHISTPMFKLGKGIFMFDEDAKVDVVHMQGCRTFQNILAYFNCRKMNIPYVVDAHGFPKEGSLLRRIFIELFDAFFANRIVRNAKFCIAETATGVQEYLRAGVKFENIVIIPCPYDLSIFDDLPARGSFRAKYKISESRKIVVYLGSLDYIKGLDLLPPIFAKSRINNDILVLAGNDSGLEKKLRKMTSGMNNVIFTGGVYGKEKLELLVDSDIALFPSRAEQGLPYAALEALMCNTPVIVGEGTGATEDVERMNCGYVANFLDIDDTIDLIEDLLEENLSRYYVNQGQKYIRETLSLEARIGDYESVYERCIV